MSESKQFLTDIKRIANHISSYAQMLYKDSIILNNAKLTQYIKPIAAGTSELQRLVKEAFPEVTSDKLFENVVKEEISRRCFIVRRLLDNLPKEFKKEEYEKLLEIIMPLSQNLNSLFILFEKTLNISTENLQDIPFLDLLNASDYSLTSYLGTITDGIENSTAGTILFTGKENGTGNSILQLLQSASYQTLTLDHKDNLIKYLEIYNISLICYDCGINTMAGMNFLQEYKSNPETRNIPILICGVEYSDLLAMQFIEQGAIDYFAPPLSKRVLFARIEAAIAQTKNNYRQQLYVRALELNRSSTSKEFTQAASYISNMLPKPFLSDSLSINYVFLPSLELGGDLFGYDWFSKTEFGITLIDVSGHGLEACLYSVIIMSLLRKRLLKNSNRKDPAKVLSELNSIFDMESQNNMFFTAWCGLYNTETRQLTYSNAGAQPAFLFNKDGTFQKLATNSTIIGADEDSIYENKTIQIEKDTTLYLLSDGVYEITKEDSTIMTSQEFTEILLAHFLDKKENINSFINKLEGMNKSKQFADDVSFIEMKF